MNDNYVKSEDISFQKCNVGKLVSSLFIQYAKLLIAPVQIMPYKKQFVPFEFNNPTDMLLCRQYIM